MSRRTRHFKNEYLRSNVSDTAQAILLNNSHSVGTRSYVASKVDKHGDTITRTFSDRSTLPMSNDKAQRIARTIHAARN